MAELKLLYLSKQDVEKIDLPMAEIIDALEVMFKEKGEGRVEMPPKPGIHPAQDAFIHAMPAFLPAFEAAGMKWVAGFPENKKKGLPYISGLIVLNDVYTGLPLSVMDCTWITAKRTGAATAVAAKYLARKDSSVVGMVACGLQGRSNLEALAHVFDIEHVKAFDINPDYSLAYADEMGENLNLNIEVTKDVKTTVEGSDIVVTSGPILKDPNPEIEAGWLSEGGFACPIDFDSFWTGEALQSVDKLATDDLAQIEYYREVGYFQNTPHPYADLGQIAAGLKPGRESDSERTISLNLGLALEDMAVSRLIYLKAVEMGIGTQLAL
ncbi:ornithine cyclodeaminase family protein [Acidobacteriota bacterium]